LQAALTNVATRDFLDQELFLGSYRLVMLDQTAHDFGELFEIFGGIGSAQQQILRENSAPHGVVFSFLRESEARSNAKR